MKNGSGGEYGLVTTEEVRRSNRILVFEHLGLPSICNGPDRLSKVSTILALGHFVS